MKFKIIIGVLLVIIVLPLVFAKEPILTDNYDYDGKGYNFHSHYNSSGEVYFESNNDYIQFEPYRVTLINTRAEKDATNYTKYIKIDEKVVSIISKEAKDVSLFGNLLGEFKLGDKFLTESNATYSEEGNQLKFNIDISYKSIPENIFKEDNLTFLELEWKYKSSSPLKSGTGFYYIGSQFGGVTLPDPYMIDRNGKKYDLNYKKTFDTLIISIPYKYLNNSKLFPIQIDPSAVAGCNNSQVNVYHCRHGTYTGQSISGVTKKIHLYNATFTATGNATHPGIFNVKSGAGSVNISNITVNWKSVGYDGSGNGLDNWLNLTAKKNLIIENSFFNGTGYRNGASDFDRGSDVSVYLNATYNITISHTTIIATGGNAVTYEAYGGNAYCIIKSNSNISLVNMTIDCRAGNGNGDASGGKDGGDGSLNFYGPHLFINNSLFKSYGGIGGLGDINDAGGAGGKGYLNIQTNIFKVFDSKFYAYGGHGGYGGNEPYSTVSDTGSSYYGGITLFMKNTSIYSYGGDNKLTEEKSSGAAGYMTINYSTAEIIDSDLRSHGGQPSGCGGDGSWSVFAGSPGHLNIYGGNLSIRGSTKINCNGSATGNDGDPSTNRAGGTGNLNINLRGYAHINASINVAGGEGRLFGHGGANSSFKINATEIYLNGSINLEPGARSNGNDDIAGGTSHFTLNATDGKVYLNNLSVWMEATSCYGGCNTTVKISGNEIVFNPANFTGYFPLHNSNWTIYFHNASTTDSYKFGYFNLTNKAGKLDTSDIGTKTQIICDTPGLLQVGNVSLLDSNLIIGGSCGTPTYFPYDGFFNDTVRPLFTSPTNTSTIYRYDNISMNITITDDQALDFYGFRWNISGAFINKTYSTSGTSINVANWSNITVPSGTIIAWQYFANDTNGNQNQSSYYIINVSNTIPRKPVITLPINGSTLATNYAIINWTYYDPDNSTSTFRTQKLKFFIFNSTHPIEAHNNKSGNYTGLSDGTYKIHMRYDDNTINSSNATLIEFYISTTSPAITLHNPPDQNWTKNVTHINISMTVTDGDGIGSCDIWHNDTGTFLKNMSFDATSGAMKNITINLSRTKGRTISWNINCTDAAVGRNDGFYAVNQTLHRDTRSPLNITIDSITEDQRFTGFDVPLNYVYAEQNIEKCTYDIYKWTSGTNDRENVTLTNCDNGTITTLDHSDYELRLYLKDFAGNTNRSRRNFTTVAPDVSTGGAGGGGGAGEPEIIYIENRTMGLWNDNICDEGESLQSSDCAVPVDEYLAYMFDWMDYFNMDTLFCKVPEGQTRNASNCLPISPSFWSFMLLILFTLYFSYIYFKASKKKKKSRSST